MSGTAAAEGGPREWSEWNSISRGWDPENGVSRGGTQRVEWISRKRGGTQRVE